MALLVLSGQRTAKMGRKKGWETKKIGKKRKEDSVALHLQQEAWDLFCFCRCFSPFQILIAVCCVVCCFSPPPQVAWPDTLSILMIIFGNGEHIIFFFLFFFFFFLFFLLSFLLALAGRGHRRRCSAGRLSGQKWRASWASGRARSHTQPPRRHAPLFPSWTAPGPYRIMLALVFPSWLEATQV